MLRLTVAILILSFSSCSSSNVSLAPAPIKDISYALRESVDLKADWYPAAKVSSNEKGASPVCIVIHGGGWYKGDKSDMESVSRRLAKKGIAAMNINYRLSPAYRFPAPILDTKDAIRWVKANSKELGVDPKKLCVFGYSAGAHLALMAGFTRPTDALDDTNPPTAKIRRFGNGSEWISKIPKDLSVRVVVGGGSPSNLFNGDYNKYYEKFFGRPPSEIPDTYRKASPLSYVRLGLPPTFLYHGSHDWVVDVQQSRHLRDELVKVKVDVEYLEVTLGHMYTFYFDEQEVDAAIKFIQAKI